MSTVWAAHELAVVLQRSGRLERATLDRILEARRRAYGASHPALASTLALAARFEFEHGNIARAAALAEEVVGTYRATYPPDHDYVLSVRLTHAKMLMALEPPSPRALDICDEVIETYERKQDRGGAATARSIAGACLTRLGRFAEAETHLEQAFVHFDAEGPTRERRIAIERLVALYEAWGRAEEAALWRKELEDDQ